MEAFAPGNLPYDGRETPVAARDLSSSQTQRHDSVAPAQRAREKTSSIRIGFLALLWVAIVGIADYWTGPEFSMLIFYLIPVTLGTWFVGRNFGLLIALLSVATGSMADVVSGLPQYWNEGMGLGSYVIFVLLLSRWRALLNQLDDRVRARTSDLREEIRERRRLEKEMNELTERERRRLGHDLHNTLCQHLAGTALCAQAVREKLVAEGSPHTEELEKVASLVEEGIDITRTLARGLFSPDLNEGSLAVSLAGLAHNTEERFGIDCEFQQDGALPSALTGTVSTQLYRIAQEAVANACKHAHASRIVVELEGEPEELRLNIYDDGIGCEGHAEGAGLGLRMMQHHADLIGAKCTVQRKITRGTLVACTLPTPHRSDG